MILYYAPFSLAQNSPRTIKFKINQLNNHKEEFVS